MLFLFAITWGAVSGWWLPACVAAGLLYAWLMYRQPVNLESKLRSLLFAIRAVVVAVIAFLLLSPLIKSVNYKPQKPLVLIAEDNSQSVSLFRQPGFDPAQFVKNLSGLKQALGDEYEVHEFNFDRDLHDGLSDSFNGKQTNIAAALKQLNDRFVNQNIGAVILATDGMYNGGSDPQYEAKNIRSTFYTVALGDTTPKRDLLIANVNYNKTAFLGNDFEIEVLLQAYQSKGEQMHLNVTEDGRQVYSQSVGVNSNSFQKLMPVKLNADKKGVRKFTINITPVKNELSLQNNTETIYVDVLDARQKILLVYNSPHPDIDVIKKAIESNKNYEVKTVQADDIGTIKPSEYSLVILHQLPSTSQQLNAFAKGKLSLWYMLGGQTDIQQFDALQKLLKVSSGRDDMQEVFALPENGFSAFTLSDSAKQKLSTLPPLLAPFGTYSSPATNQVLLRQRIGNVNTSYPLLAFADEGGNRTAVLAGEGLWRWALAEYKNSGNHHAIEELFSQSVQYLTANANRQQFRVYPAKNVFDEGENVLLNAELYNDALELVNTPDVKIELKSSAGKNYSFLFSRNGQSYQLDAGTLPVGEYTYTANTKLGNKSFNASGQLMVRALNLETRQSAANHQLLAGIAKASGGQMIYSADVNKLADMIRKNENIKTVVYQDKHYSELIDVKWVFVLILALLTAEWFLRKREGLV